MRKVLALLSALFFAGCQTAGSDTPAPEYQTGDCLTVDEALLVQMPPQAQQMIKLMALKVVDRGEKYYVVEVSLMNQVQGLNAVEFAQAQKETNRVDCPKTEE
jgi:hypothetical protein